mgnify:CR=1 FL=1
MCTWHIPPYVKHKTVTKTRNSDPMQFILVQTSSDEYIYSFWPRTINDWNSLQPNKNYCKYDLNK